MKVYGFKKETEGLMEIENALKAMQDFVGGHIEAIGFGNGIDLICNDEGKINGLLPVAVWLEDGEIAEVICGDCFLCRHDNEGNFVSINDEDVNYIKTKLLSTADILKKLVFIKPE